ncbi:non-ribosomal peptide synthetase [Corynascus novoguineensis]|uniref:Non-ribosomal peptide synthetase n=1 Tax=Corynascus novoguineensis TaxID=1126955 RepID=A0AAN7CQS3_9PEZI|nr:non-ribosomal peptide synthetase [Corynascus novoguineensis]
MHSSRLSNDITRKSFWAQRLQTIEAAPDAPLFFDRIDGTPSTLKPAAVGLDGYSRTKAVMAVDASNLQEAASMHNLSEDTLVLTAWAILLRAYAGEDGPVSFGVCLDREQAAWLSTMAMSGDDGLLSVMRAAEQDMKLTMGHTLPFHSLGAFAEGTGFGTIASAVYIHSWKSRFPEMHLPSMATAFVNIAQGTMVHLHLSFRKDAMSLERAQSVIDNYAHVINVLTLKLRSVGRLDADELFVKTIDTVSRNDYNRIVEFSAPLPLKLDDCVHDLILAKCAKPENASRVAVTAWDGSFTYAELAKQAFRLAAVIASKAHQLNTRAEGKQLFVPFFLTKSKWTPVAILATLAAGGACVPLEPSHPAARRNDILGQLQAPIVLTNKALQQTLAKGLDEQTPVRHLVCVDGDEKPSANVPLPYVQPDNLCWVIFTSGSTGSPKGVKWQHSTLATSVWEHGREFHMNESTRVLQFASHVFDVSVVELVTPLVHGGCIVIPSDDHRLEPKRLAKFMESMKVNTALFAASFARLLDPALVPSLRTLILGGESIGQENIEKWTPALDRFIIGYGSAETCINCAKNEFSVQTKTKKPWKESLGHAIGARMLIADRFDSDRLAPIGAVGEIIVEGPILAQGYLNDEAKTAKSFIQNPAWVRKTHFYPATAQRRFYRTGDLGRQAMDGSISFAGRADFQVKIRGQRMELDEVRFHVVKAMPEAVDVHVDVISPVGEKILAAFLSFGRGSGIQDGIQIHPVDENLAEAFRRAKETLRGKLPVAAVPTFFIPIVSFPYLVSGKVNRRQLLEFANQSSIKQLSSYARPGNQAASSTQPTPSAQATPSSQMAASTPVTPVEKILVSCCRDVLKNPSFGPDDNFLVSGGDSISAIKVASAARDRGVSVTVADLFNAPTIRALAQAASGAEAAADNEELDIPVALSLLPSDLVDEIVDDVKSRSPAKSKVLDVYPCTPLQEALVTASSMRIDAYIARHTLELPPSVDINRFKAAWAAVIQRHDILRTRIFEGPHGAVQVVYDSELAWHIGSDLEAYCEQDRSLPMSFGDNLVRLGLVGRTFMFTIHHSLFDGWSITRLFEDVEREYAGLEALEARPHKLYIQHLSQLDSEAPKEYWASKLASDTGLAASHFPQTISSAYTPVPDSEVKMKLAVTDNTKSEFTMPTRIRAAWALLVGRYLDSQDVVFGETFSGRSLSLRHVEAIAGPTISTAPVRVSWDSDDSVETLLRRIQKDVLQIDANGHIGIQAISKLSPSAAEACQFQHIIVIQPKMSSMMADAGDKLQRRIGLATASLDLRGYHSYALNMDFTLEDDGITVTTTFDSAVFSKQQIQHLQAQFGHVLNQLCRAQDLAKETINGIDYASRKDRELQIKNNRQKLHYDRTTLIQAMERHVVSQPTAPAVYAWDGSLNYRELDRGSSALANHLSALGVQKGDYVPYCFPKSVWTTLSILGALKIGAVAVAVEPSHPDSSILKVLSQVKPKVVLCAPTFFSRIKAMGFRPFSVEENAIRSISQRTTKKRYSVHSSDTAFVVFTSGSTGEPKGIPLDHGAVCIMAKQHGEVMNIDKTSRILQFAAHVFDVSIGDFAISIYHGACLCVPSDHDRMNNLAAAINKLKANRAWLTPTVASLISPAECPTMEWLSVGGEQLTQACKDIWDGVPLVNVYGPAEVTNLGTAVKVSRDLPITNIGRANGTRLWVCEPGNPKKLAPTGCIGEIVFEGPNVTRGYLNNAKLTESAFPDVLSWTLSEGLKKPVRMYRTGDLARLNVDGSIDFQGRRDTQIKLRGQRLEITAIETALRSSIEEPVELAIDVLDRTNVGRDAFLIAFLHLPGRLQGQANTSTGLFSTLDIKELVADIRSKLSRSLPPHMIPTLFIPLNTLQKLVSGKIDRKTLRLAAAKLTDEAISSYKVDQSVEKRQPSTEEEAAMQKLWANVLRLPEAQIGMDDNFVTLGGDSITAIKIVSQARAQGVTISVASIFQHGSIANLCGSMSTSTKLTQASAGSRAPRLQHPQLADIALQCSVAEDDIEDIFPTTALQDGMMMLTEKNPTAYIAHHIMELPSWVDVAIFRRAWQTVTDENPILRTRIVPAGLQAVLRPAPVQWLTSRSNDLSAYIRELRQNKIGFGTALTQHAILSNPTRFVFTAHHSVYDGWSMGLLSDAITQACKKLAGMPTTPQKDQGPKINFHTFVNFIGAIDKNQASDFWRQQLDGCDPAAFPPSLPSSYQPLANALLEKKIPFPRAQRSTFTPSTLIRAAWAILISAYSGSHNDVVFGESVTGRSAPLDGVLSLIGPTLATVPFRVTVDWAESVNALLNRVQMQSFSMLEFEQYGLQNIKKSVPTAAAACDFQSLLVVHSEVPGSNPKDQLLWSSERATSDFLTNALTLECQPVGSQLALTASYDSSIMDERQMERMLTTFHHILRQLCQGESNKNLRLQDIDTISPSDRAEIAAITKTLPPLINDRVHDMFARQAMATPSAIAVSAWDGDLTYSQLDDLSNRLARHLRSLGVGPEWFTPFAFEKSKWVPVTQLAILKAGGACVPLDPSQPLDRLTSIIGTLDAKVVVTSATHADLLTSCSQVQHFVAVSQAMMDHLPKHGGPAVNPQTSPSSACYAIFTSGSTGTPKGVVWEHATLCSSMTEHGAAFNYSTSTRVLQFSSHTFDVSVSELLTTLMFGGCICIPDDFTRLNGIANFMNEKRVNWTFFAPSFARLMDPATVPGLKTIVLGGEAPGKDNIERWSGRPGLELIVTYGPAESCIYCAKNSVRGPQIPGSIGHSIGGMMWVADLGRPTELAPIGSVGEIVVEGSILARGYLKDPAKTAASFRPMPAKWANGRSSRVYYTGDLGRVNTDGTISCLGRRDDQVKIRGQRVELPDIEYHLRKDECVRQALVLYPRSGPCADHLVGILSMVQDKPTTGPASSTDITLANPEDWVRIPEVQDRLSQKVPVYMIPAIWIVLNSIPLMPASQKVNKKMVSEWAKAMDQATYEQIAGLSAGNSSDELPAMNTPLEEQVRSIWSDILNVGLQNIGPNTSFLRLGGDSISAMQVVTRCRNAGIMVTVQDLLKAKTISEFCQRAALATNQATTSTLVEEPESETPFALAPIQKWFMQLAPNSPNYFNQSHLLRFTQGVDFNKLQDALAAIAQRHPMLRARFQQAGGNWQQYISSDISGSLRCCQFRSVWTMQKVIEYASAAQASLDITRGPLMAADLYEMTDGTAVLFITCHHMVIDLVSWRIVLQELEEFLRTGLLASTQKPLGFRTWCRLLEEHAKSVPNTVEIPVQDFGFWGINSADNTAAQVVEQNFSLDDQATELLMGRCNEPFNTEPLDLLLTAVAHSFNQVFRAVRGSVAIFNEGHGHALRSLKEVKDIRRQIPEKGLPFFTSFAQNATTGVEITFNYFGLFQNLEREGALLNRMSWAPFHAPSDSAPDVPRFSIFDVSAGVENGVLTMNFTFNNRIKHRHLVQQWIEACSDTLRDLVQATSQRTETSLTLSDFSHLRTSYDELSTLLNKTLPAAGIAAANVQDIYSCSPMQTALLVSQSMDPTLYAVRYVWEVIPKSSQLVSMDKLVTAWKAVVKQHPMLRTVFVQASSSIDGKSTSAYTQVVLKELEPNVLICEDATTFPVGRPEHHIANGPPHQVVLAQQASGKVLVQLDISHTLIDGSSVNILLDTFVKAYDGAPIGVTSQEAYGSYISFLGNQDMESSRNFWNTYLSGAEPCHFPTLRSGAPSAARKLEYLDFAYPDPAKLHSLCANAETTAASVYKLAWALLLRAYTGNNSPCFGYLASGRDLPIEGIAEAVGPFINMLVCKIPLEDDDSKVETVLKTAHSDYANCLSHQLCSLAEIQRGLGLGGDRLFNTVMSVQRLSPPGTNASTVEFRPVHVEDPSEFDIALNIGDAPDFVDVSLTYSTDVLSAHQAKSLASTFTRAIDSVLDSMSQPVRDISLLAPEDHQQIMAWNSIATVSPVSAQCDQLIGLHLATKANKPAIAGWDLSLTYSELDALANTVARHLVSQYSVTPNTLVPFCFEKSAWTIVAMLGIMKAGAAFVPLDPKHPIDRLVSIAKRVQAPLVVCSEQNEHIGLDIGGNLSIPYLLVGPRSIETLKASAMNRTGFSPLNQFRKPSDLAYCLFTSGSTGTPKGVLIQHEALCSGATMHGRTFNYTAQVRTLQFASYGFDACITEIFTTLVMGGCVCVPSEEQRMDKDKLMDFVNEQGVNHALLTPSVLALMDPLRVPSITTLLLGGEAASYQLIDKWRAPTRRVLIAYGPTECTVICAGHDATDPDTLRPGKSSIGNSVASVAWIGDARDHNKLVPIGAIGELLVEGPILARGYLDDEAKTSAAFVNPAWAGGHRRMYRTGDLVRYQEDGTMEYLGRRDNQVKLRGQRLELGEIEEQLIKRSEIQQCAVLLVKEGLCANKLVAVLTLKTASNSTVAGRLALASDPAEGVDVLAGDYISATTATVGQALSEVLPSFMVPSCWIVSSKLPLMASGKTDRRFLTSCVNKMSQEMYQLCTGQGSSSAGAEQEGLTAVEKAILQVWSAVLNTPEQSINPSAGSFVKMGGDSISAMEVVAQCRGKGIPLRIEQLLKAKSVKQLAAPFEDLDLAPTQAPAAAENASITTAGSVQKQQEEEEEDDNITMFGLSPIQRMFTRLSPGENHFNQSFLLKVSTTKARVSEDAMRQALDVVVKRHAMLRARFQKLGRSFKQWIEPVVEDSYVFQSWDMPASTEFSPQGAEQIRNTQQSLDLENGPVFAGDLFNVGSEQYVFLTAHHLVIDLVSWRIVLKDLEDYLVSGAISTYRSLSFEKWCGLLNNHRKTLMGTATVPFEVASPDYKYWGMAGKPNYASDFEHHQFSLSAATSELLLGPCNEPHGTESLDLFFAAVMHSFAATFLDRDIPPIYNEGHGREPWDPSMDLSRTVGWFTTIAPVWVDSRRCNKDILEYVKQVKEVRRNTPQKGFSYFSSLDLERKPFSIEVSFNYFGSFQQLDRDDALLKQVHFHNIDVDPCEVSDKHKKFSLIDINAESENNQLVFTFSFNSKMSRRDDIERWINNYQKSLEHMSRVLGPRDPDSLSINESDVSPVMGMELAQDPALKALGISVNNVEDIYPCTPSQQGMLLSQTKDAEMYWFRSVYELEFNTRAPITFDKLRQAWKAVVRRHPVLRTIFIEQNSTDGLYDQLVLGTYEPDVIEDEVPASMSEVELAEFLKIRSVPSEMLCRRAPQHQLRLVRQSFTGRVFCSFLLSHAIADGGSMGVILRDFSNACEARPLDAAKPLLKHYIDYIQSRDASEVIGFWKKSLDNIEPCMLQTEEQPTMEKELHKAEVPVNKVNYPKMQAAARELGVSLFTLLQVTWALTLREYVNPDRDQCCFGIVTSGRDLPVKNIGSIVGPLVNILVSRVALPHDQTVAQIAEAVHDNFVDMLAHQTSSLAEITHELGSGTLFNTGMTLQKAMAGGEDSSAVSFRPMGGQDPTEFDLVVQALDNGQALRVHMSYWCDKVSDNRANSMADTFASILSQIVNNPNIRPVDLEMASDRDIQQLWTWNASLPAAVNLRIEEMIAQRTAEHPNQEAVWSTEDTLTYEQLDLLSSRIAQGFLADVEREEVVPLCFEKSIWIAVSMLAVLKAGGTIVLMDPSHPLERLRCITSTVKANRVLASPLQADLCLNRLGLQTVVISKDMFKRRSGVPGTAPRSFMTRTPARSSADAAYVVFTSGSTGTPKGSVTEHRSFCTATQGYHQAIGQLPGERVLQFASYSFDASFLEILGSLMVGATVCVPTEQERSDQLVSFINRSSTTFAVITPTVASLMEPEQVPTLSCLALCGEPMTTTHIATWANKVRLVNAFGPSECCVGSAANSFVTEESSPKCIGKAVSCCYWVVHPRNHNRLARIGSIGELLIEGPILARHYLNEPVKTRDAFISNPDWARPGRATRLYKTGDLVLQNPDGSFQYVGRKDTQAKIFGQRLELGDIEQAFRDVVPEAENVVAEIAQAEGQAPRLVLFFSAKNISIDIFDVSATQAKLAKKLPAYMVPSVIVPLDQMPLMPSGKADRKKIKALGASLPVVSEERSGRLPATEMEMTMASLWKEVIKSAPARIMADDSFFHVGGDSYTAMKLVTAARARGISLNVAAIMQTPKLTDMAKKATPMGNEQQPAFDAETAVPFSMVEWNSTLEAEVCRQCNVSVDIIEDVYPCTPLQEGLFVLSIRQAGAYVARHSYRLPPSLDLIEYKKAWNAVYKANAILRTHIVQLEKAGGNKRGGLYQAVINKPLVWKHAASLDEFAISRPVSLGGALAEFAIVEENANSRYLVLTMHHAAYDASSLGMLLQDVETVYNGGQLPSRLPYREFIKQLQDTPPQATRDFWARYLEGAQSADFPSIPSGYVPAADTNYESDLIMLPANSGFTASTMIRVAWAMVLGQHAETSDVVFGETLSGRNGSEDTEMQGPMITTLPIRCSFDEYASINNVLSSMQSALVDMIPYQHAGVQNIKVASRSAAAACNFGCLVTIAPESSAPTNLGLGLTPVDVGAPPAMSHPLSVQFILGDDGKVKVSVYHDHRLVGATQVEKMVAQFVHVLGQLCGGEKKMVTEIEVEATPGFTPADADAGFGRDVLGALNEEIEDLMEEISSHSSQELSKSGTSSSEVTGSTGDMEQMMKELWADILGMQADEISSGDNFFHLGGDSIASMRLVTAAERKRIKVTVADVFQHPTLEELCEFAAQANVTNVTTEQEEIVPEPAIQEDYDSFGVIKHLGLDQEEVVETVCQQLSVFPGDVEDVYPATDYQAWAISHGLMRSRGNTNYFLFRLHGQLDTFRLEQACRKMVTTNPILRTLFTTLRGQVMQVVVRSYQIEFLRYGSEHNADDNFINYLVEQDTQRSAYLTQSIVRFKLVLHADGHYILIMRMSHAQYDGMCMPLLIQDLEKCYNGQEPKERPSFGKFIQGATLREEQAINFWGNMLEGSTMTEIVEHSGPSHKHNVDTIRTRTIPPIPVNVAGMSQATLVKAAWALVLAKMSGQRDIVFGNLIFGRNMPVSGIEDISGPCINIIPVRVRVNAMDSIHDLLALVQEQQMAAMPHENLGFRRLIKNCTDWPHWTRFSSVVQHQQLGRDGSEGQEFKLSDNLMCEMGVLGPAYDSSDLWVQTTPHTDCFKVEIGSCSSVVQPAVAEMLLDKLCATLSVFAATEVGNSPHLWEMLARDGPPIIPIKSSIVEEVWSKVLPDADTIPWDTPYFDIWGDEIAPARFLEEYAEHGLHFDMEDILENPTKQAQMMLTSRAQSDKSRGRSPRPAPAPPVPTRARAFTQDSAQSATATTNARGFWILDPSKSSKKSSRASSSRGSSTLGSPLVASPRMGVAMGVLPPRRKSTMPMSMPGGRRSTMNGYYAGSATPSTAGSGYYSLSSAASSSANIGGAGAHQPMWADRNKSYAALSPPLTSEESGSESSAPASVTSPRQSALRPFKLPEYAQASSSSGSSAAGGEGERPKLRRKKVNSFPVGFGVGQTHGAPVLNGRW